MLSSPTIFRSILFLPLVIFPLLTYLFASNITATIATFIKPEYQLASAGTFYPSFGDPRGFAHQLAWISFFFLLTSPLYLVPKRYLLRVLELFSPSGPVIKSLSLLLVSTTGALYCFLASPPNAFPSNAAIHWVDGLLHPAYLSRYPLIGAIHSLFYDYPAILMALLGATNCYLMYRVGKELLSNQFHSVLMAMSFVLSAPMLIFANMAEGLHIVVCLTLLASLFYLQRKLLPLVITIFLGVLARPQLLSLVGAIMMAEFASSYAQERSLKRCISLTIRNSFLMRLCLWLGAAWIVYQGLTAIGGFNMFYQVGEYNVMGYLNRSTATAKAVAVDGKTIRMFSGSYIIHFLWAFPWATTACSLYALVRSRLANDIQYRFLAFALTYVTINIVFHDLFPINYYNIRYLSYVYPTLLLSSWLVMPIIAKQSLQFRLLVAGLLTFGPFFMWNSSLSTKIFLEDHRLTPLVAARFELRELQLSGDSAKLFTNLPAKQDKNFIAYVFKTPRSSIDVVKDISSVDGVFIFTGQVPDSCSNLHSYGEISVCRIRHTAES